MCEFVYNIIFFKVLVFSECRADFTAKFSAIYSEITDMAEKLGVTEGIPRRTGRQVNKTAARASLQEHSFACRHIEPT
jgi:hypothetical protein